MDNRRLLVVSDSRKSFELAMQLAWEGCPGGRATGFAERTLTDEQLDARQDEGVFWPSREYVVVFWHVPNPRPEDYQAFLGGGIGLKTATEYLWDWVQSRAKWEGGQGFIDGEDGGIQKGFAIYNEAWGHVDEDSYAFMAIAPAPALYGK